MKYTKDDLAKMGGFEINKELCILRGLVVAHEQYTHYSDRDENVVLLEGGDSFDFNNWNGIMPLAIEHEISLMFCNDIDGWMGIKNNLVGVSHYFRNTTPQRAIACCLILVLQERQQ